MRGTTDLLAGTTSRGRPRVTAVAVAVATALALAACGGAGDGGTADGSPTAPASPTATPGPDTVEVAFAFVMDTPLGFRITQERHPVPVGDDLAEAALRALLDEGLRPLDPDYVSLWAEADTRLISLTREGGTAVVDLAYGRLNVGSESEARALDQLLWTMAEADPSITAMRITVDGETVESLAGHVDATGVFELPPSYEVLAAIVIDDPLEGQERTGPVTISGEACTFEANVAWELLRGGVVIDAGATTAAIACPDRSPWSVDLGPLEPGTYVFRAYESSAMDGSLVVEDTRTFVVIG